jgi:predicted DNA-binding protein
MRATTIRFTPELWELMQREAEREGVSVAQYVRDAALFRVAYSAGERGEQGTSTAPSQALRQVPPR